MNGYIPQIKITLSKKVTLIKEASNATLILMPSMRFNRSYNQAFQISISGVINFNKDYFSSGISSFPAPMISWLRKF